MKHAWTVCLGFGILLTGCGISRDPLVAEVGPYQITAGSLRAFVEELPEGFRPQKAGDEARRYYLQSMIDGRLLLMEARALGLDTTRTVRTKVQNAVQARVRFLYRTREITGKVEISEEEVRDYFRAEGFDRERRFSGIMVGSRAALDTVLGKLQNGHSFEEVARAHSLDERSARQGGELGFIGRDIAPRAHIPPQVFRSLPLGEVSAPLRAGRNWHVVRFTEERPVSYEQYRSRVEALLFEERVSQVEKEHLELLRESFRARLHPAGLQELLAAYRKRNLSPLTSSQTPLFLYEKGEISVAEVQEVLVQLNIRSGFADSAQAASTLERFVLNPFLVEEAARQAGFYDQAEIRQLARGKEEEVLLETLKKRVIAQPLTISEDEVRQYYDSHPEIFTHEPAVWIEELLLPTESEAREMRRQIEAGVLFADLADSSLRKGARENGGRTHFHPREKALYPRLMPVVMESPPGELVGPLEVEGGYSVFRVLGYEDASIEPYETARRRALALVRWKRENQALGTLMEQLREKFASRIEIYESRLSEAVPDSLVQDRSAVPESEKTTVAQSKK